MSNQPLVQWHYIIYFYLRGPLLTTFSTSFWKRIRNSKETVNIQGLFVLTVGYVDMTTYPLKIITIYLIYLYIFYEYTFILAVFITVSRRYERDFLHASRNILFYIVFYIINTMNKQDSFIPRSYLRYKKVPFPPPPQSTICSYAPVSIFAIEYYEYYENFIYTVC